MRRPLALAVSGTALAALLGTGVTVATGATSVPTTSATTSATASAATTVTPTTRRASTTIGPTTTTVPVADRALLDELVKARAELRRMIERNAESPGAEGEVGDLRAALGRLETLVRRRVLPVRTLTRQAEAFLATLPAVADALGAADGESSPSASSTSTASSIAMTSSTPSTGPAPVEPMARVAITVARAEVAAFALQLAAHDVVEGTTLEASGAVEQLVTPAQAKALGADAEVIWWFLPTGYSLCSRGTPPPGLVAEQGVSVGQPSDPKADSSDRVLVFASAAQAATAFEGMIADTSCIPQGPEAVLTTEPDPAGGTVLRVAVSGFGASAAVARRQGPLVMIATYSKRSKLTALAALERAEWLAGLPSRSIGTTVPPSTSPRPGSTPGTSG